MEMDLFDEINGQTQNRTVNFSECLNHEIQSKKVLTELDNNICGQYDTLLNKALSNSFKLKELLGESFYSETGFFDLNRLTPEIEELQSMVYFNALACTIIKEMFDYIINDKRLVFMFDFENVPLYVSSEELIRVLVYKLRKRKFNAVKNVGNGNYYIYVNSLRDKDNTTLNNVSDGANYLKDIVFADIDLDGLPLVKIRVGEFTKLIGTETFNRIYLNTLNDLPYAKRLMQDLIEVCNNLNDIKYKKIPMLKAKQLNTILIELLNSVLRFTGIETKEDNVEDNNLNYLNVSNPAKDKCKTLINNGLDFEKYLPLCDIIGKVILFTDNFMEQPDELTDEKFEKINRKVNYDLVEMYEDFCKMFIKKGKVCAYSPIANYNIW